MKHLNKIIYTFLFAALVIGQYEVYDQQWGKSLKQEKDRIIYNKKIRVIAIYIKEVNPNVSIKKAKLFAKTIMEESTKRNIDPFLQTALLKSESTFYSNPRHSIAEVKGMGGVYWKWWSKDLRNKKIADTICDLEDPIINIEASTYILAKYKKLYKDKAVAHYKGYTPKGKQQAVNVKLTYAKLQKRYNLA